jgi:putative transposase
MENNNKTALAKSMGVSRSSLYYESKMDLRDEIVKVQILSVLIEHLAYGHRRIAMALGYGKNRVLRVMKKYKIKPKVRRKKKPHKPLDSKEPEKYINLVKEYETTAPNEVWAGDFTYIKFQEKFYYVATVIDIYSREILSVVISNHHEKTLVIEAYNQAVKKSKTTPKYMHTDQGSEYCSKAYIERVERNGTQISMAAKGKPWENPFQESFYAGFKLELKDPKTIETLGELTEAIYQQIYYYNNKRIHSALKMPPKSFAKLHSHNITKKRSTV